MAALGFISLSERRRPAAPEVDRARTSVTDPRLAKYRGHPALLALLCALLTGLGSTALTLGAVSQVWAQPEQIWQFSIDPSFTLPDGSRVNFPLPPLSVTVQSTGSFSFTRTVECPGGGTGTGNGAMTGTTLRFSGTATGCGLPAPVPFIGQATLNQPFPNATSASGGTLTGMGVTGTFTASCTSSCPPSQQQQIAQATAGAQQAATLGNVAVLTTSVQNTNVGLRLAALRGGATGVSLSGVALTIDGQPVPLASAAGLLASLGGGASADQSRILGRLGIFANGQGSFGEQDVTSREPGFDFHTVGMTLGADYRIADEFVLGAAFGYLRTKIDLDSSAGDSTINGYSLSAYASYYLQKFYVDGIFTFGWNTYDNERSITGFDATATSATSGTQLAFSVNTGYNFNVGAFTFGPTGRVNYIQVDIDGYQETGADPFNLRIRRQTIQSLTTDLGAQVTYAISTGWGVLMPLLRFEWEHEFLANSRSVTASVVSDPTTAVSVLTSSPDRNYFNLGAGLSATFKRGISAFGYSEVVLGRSNFIGYSFNAGVRFEF